MLGQGLYPAVPPGLVRCRTLSCILTYADVCSRSVTSVFHTRQTVRRFSFVFLSGRPRKSIQSGIARRDLTIRSSLMGKGRNLLLFFNGLAQCSTCHWEMQALFVPLPCIRSQGDQAISPASPGRTPPGRSRPHFLPFTSC